MTSAQITLLLENAEIFKNYFSQRVCLEYSENILFPKQKFQTSLIIQQTCGEAAHTTVFLQNWDCMSVYLQSCHSWARTIMIQQEVTKPWPEVELCFGNSQNKSRTCGKTPSGTVFFLRRILALSNKNTSANSTMAFYLNCKSCHILRNATFAIFRQRVPVDHQKYAQMYFTTWPLAKFDSFLLWMITSPPTWQNWEKKTLIRKKELTKLKDLWFCFLQHSVCPFMLTVSRSSNN